MDPPHSVESEEYEESAEKGRTFIRQSRIKAKLFTGKVLNRMNSKFGKKLNVVRNFDGVTFDDHGMPLKTQKPNLNAIFKDVPIEVEDGDSCMPDHLVIRGIDPCRSERKETESSFFSMAKASDFPFAMHTRRSNFRDSSLLSVGSQHLTS